MTANKSFKRLVRTRMQKTGESYTAARTVLLAAEPEAASDPPPFTIPDASIRQRTGRGWEEWLDLLDAAKAFDLRHPEIVKHLHAEYDVDGWSAQAITVSYERARGLRAVGETSTGFTAGASKTVAVDVDTLFDAFVDPRIRARWLPEAQLRERTSTRPRSARYDWGDGTTRVVVGFEAKSESKALVALQHERLDGPEELARMKAFWRERLATLKKVLEA